MESTEFTIGTDRPLTAGQALEYDKLGRSSFANSVIQALKKINLTTGFVVSVEGAWGSGKTSTLAMIEEILGQQEIPPLVVNFNPWLVGDRDVLLRLFLEKIAGVVKLTDHAKSGKKAAKELKSYAKAFDVIKLIPGAEPWASIVKSVMLSVGEATSDVSELKTPDIESQKEKVEDALKKLKQPIIVFIDDIDRLFPQEVFEMIRIIKAVGDLPNVGYVIAWDANYVQQALSSIAIPQASTYLDKIVQVRMPLPSLSISAKTRLINEALETLPIEAHKIYFPEEEERMSSLYFSGLREFLEQPRDITRLFNTVAVIEPALRGEIVFADIVGLAALMIKAPTVFQLLQSNPRWFVGYLPSENVLGQAEDIIKEGQEKREEAFKKCNNPEAVNDLVHFLFPLVEAFNKQFSFGHVSNMNGHLADPRRLCIALQLSVGDGDVSLTSARKYLLLPRARPDIEATLNTENCLEFLEHLGRISKTMTNLDQQVDIKNTSLSIAQFVDREPCCVRAKSKVIWALSPEEVAANSIKQLIYAIDETQAALIAREIVLNPQSLTVATNIIEQNFLKKLTDEPYRIFTLISSEKTNLIVEWAQNVLAAAESNKLFSISDPDLVLRVLQQLSPKTCSDVFAAIIKHDPSLDNFVFYTLQNLRDSHKGQVYALPKDLARIEAYISIDELRNHAGKRMLDPELIYPLKAAWQSIVENRPIYGIDGSIYDELM